MPAYLTAEVHEIVETFMLEYLVEVVAYNASAVV